MVRVFDEARTAHLERLQSGADGAFIYRLRRYDFDAQLAVDVGARRLTRLQTAWALATGGYELVELNEPAAIRNWPSLVLYVTVLRLSSLVRRRRVRVLYYAIENFDVADFLRVRLHLPLWVARRVSALAFRWLIPSGTRIAFGTDQAAALYRAVNARALARAEVTLIPALSAVCDACDLPDERLPRVTFLGAFERRKGLQNLMACWPGVLAAEPDAELAILGKGPLEAVVAEWARSRTEVTLRIDPPRGEVHEVLRHTKVLVLLSERDGGWREQVGLPIVEALSHGCRIVTTTETGIAPWLLEHGHVVLSQPDRQSTTAAVRAALADTEPASSILRQLPAIDGRLHADTWLTRA
ncbi:hypothetical protein Back2_13980 [Nocardioides baekrokdamisoli]|uniref:Glycosyl transferase family 1 domain-containing protein n=1 Tax=Nocardioides baekrokdamisoli TaxID=1804624 RepID=A0A3G9IU05_9ACTN|nr:hypothetical protein Back2_13980 [Nocardioides baekrokdamisoli]